MVHNACRINLSVFDIYYIVLWQFVVQLLLVAAVFGHSKDVERDPRCPLEHKPDHVILYPHSKDCSKFYACSFSGTLDEKACPEGHQFDVDSLVRIIWYQ